MGTGFAGTASGASAGSTERRIVGTESRRAAATVKRRATRVVREIDFGRFGCAVVGEFPEGDGVALEGAPAVRYVEPEVEVRVFGDPVPDVRVESEKLPWGVDRIDADLAHDAGRTGVGVDVAIIDSGIDSDHPDLVANLGQGYAVTPCEDDCRRAWDDDHNHGTHVAGIVAAVSNDTGIVGVGSDATLHAVKAMSADGHGDSSTLAEGLRWAADRGYDVANMSLGGTSPSSVMHDAVKYATDEGMAVVAAAGNEEPDEKTVHYPAAFPEAIAVGAIDPDDDMADFSLTGDALELVAPGGEIPSTVRGGYEVYSGTSMATPHVSGAVALLAAQGYSAADARQRLAATAEDLGHDEEEQGNGLVDVEAALAGSDDGPTGTFSVATHAATQLEPTSGTLNGELTGLGDHASATVGFEYWQTGQKSATASTVESGTRSAVGQFEASVSELSAETSYTAVAFASDGSDTARGTERTFTTPSGNAGGGDHGTLSVETGEPTDVGRDEATLTGQLTDLGPAEEVETGFEYWVEGRKEETLDDEDATDLESPGSFEETVDLAPGTTYLVQAYAIDEDDESRIARGESVAVTTAGEDDGNSGSDAPLGITTGEPTDVDEDEVTVSGHLTGLGGAESVTVSVEYWPEGAADGERQHAEVGEFDEPEAFEADLEDLDSGTTYVAQAVGVASDGREVRGARVSVTTSGDGDESDAGDPLAITTGEPTDVDEDEATVPGHLTGLGGAESVAVGVEYWPEGAADGGRERVDADELDEPDDFEAELADLTCATSYVVAAVGVASDGREVRGETFPFTTARH